MPVLVTSVKIGLYLLMTISVIAAICSVTLPNLFHSALALIVALIGVAGIFFALNAEFLGVVQILIYVGAVMTLVIFAIMLTNRINEPQVKQSNQLSLPALFFCIVFLMLMGHILLNTPWPIRPNAAEQTSLVGIGQALMGRFVFPFEVISVVLIAALIGAVIVARRDKEA